MNRRLHHVLPPELGIEPVTLLDFPVREFEIGDLRQQEQEELSSIVDLSEGDVAQSLFAASSSLDSPFAQMFAVSITPSCLAIWKGEAWIECQFHERTLAGRNAMLLLKVPQQELPQIHPDWPAGERQLMRVLSGLREDHPPSGGAFWDARVPATFFNLDESEQFPRDAFPGQLIFTARNGDLIVRENGSRYVWWRSACSERVLLARDAADFEACLLKHFANDWVVRTSGQVLWPFDGFGPSS